ncbi:MAG: hypothetical protein M1822_004502 [Bathelium mastoideum]|nr:MAG: hypothetical protein M1822_004502 [Bathelium mastoideum]
MDNVKASQRELQEQAMRNAQMRQQQIISRQQQATPGLNSNNAVGNTSSSQRGGRLMAVLLDNIPIEAADYNISDSRTATLESACRDGPVEKVRSIIASEQSTPRFLHSGFVSALKAGQVEIARCLLSEGAVINGAVPSHILSAPTDQQILLFELLAEYGWTPSTLEFHGNLLLSRVVTNPPLLQWLLDHGVDPNIGAPRANPDRRGGPEYTYCSALEMAASQGSLEAVRTLLDAGARIEHRVPLHCAAGAHPEGTNIHYPPVRPSREVDADRIPIMALLVERGADVNERDESPQMVPRLAILLATMAGAVERVKWLLEHGANPEAHDAYGTAVLHAQKYGSEEMKKVMEEGVVARRWVQTQDSSGS